MTRKLFRTLLLITFLTTSQVFAERAVYNVKDYGAVGDGKNLDTDHINKAILACAADGGGTVYFPAGTYLSGSIRLKSNLTLYIDSGATIMGAPGDINAYDPPEEFIYGKKHQDFGHSYFRNSLIWGEDLENVTITGFGIINGGGMDHGRDGDPPPGQGNKAIALKKCTSVTISDITMLHCGHFAILATGCKNLTIDNLTIDTNRDGMDIDVCQNVTISNCRVNSHYDDAIVFKGSYALGDYYECKNITVTNCFVSGFFEGTMIDGTCKGKGIGRIKFGTESNCDFRNVTVSNCVFDSCNGIALNSVDGATVENVIFSNLIMKNVYETPFFLRLGYRGWARDKKRGPGKRRNIKISNVLVDGSNVKYCAAIMGIPNHPVENVEIENVNIIFDGGGTEEMAQIKVPEKIGAHPWINQFNQMPAYGFYGRHVKNLTFNNVKMSYKNDLESRPVCWFEDVEMLELNDFVATSPTGDSDICIFKGVTGLSIDNYRIVGNSK